MRRRDEERISAIVVTTATTIPTDQWFAFMCL
jgi:hypothetical protein